MQAFGWRATAFASGVVVLAVGLPLCRMFRGRPHELGEFVDGIRPEPAQDAAHTSADAASVSSSLQKRQAAEDSPSDAPNPLSAEPMLSAADEARRGFTLQQAIRTRAFWLLSIGHGAALLIVGAVNVHAITHMKEGLGYSVNAASMIIMLMTLSQIGGVFLGIWIGDRFQKRRVAAIAMLGHFVGLLMLTYASGYAMLIAFAMLHGVAWGVRGPFMQAIRADYFGRRAIGMILGVSAVFVAIGQIGGPLVAGIFVDWLGDYRVGFTALALLSLIGAWAFVAAVQPVHPALRSAEPEGH